MKIYKNCKYKVLYYSDASEYGEYMYSGNDRYIVKISDDEISVTYDDERGAVCYAGPANGEGHYVLTAPERSGTATLHRFPNGMTLEGYWVQENVKGMWRIFLED